VAKSTVTTAPRAAFSITETCASLGCSRDWLYRRLNDGTIRSIKLAGRRFIPASELDRIAQGEERT
jgi:excisionase family DNA binding protein